MSPTPQARAWPTDRGRAARLRSRVRPEGQADQGAPSGAEPPQPGNRAVYREWPSEPRWGAAILLGGSGVNPARAVGRIILAGKFTDWRAYLAAPVVAGSLAVLVYDRVLRRGSALELLPQ